MSKQRLEQKLNFSLSPQQIQFLGLLQTPVVSLEKKIEEELEENPALEEDEEETNSQKFTGKHNNMSFESYQIEDKSESLQDYLKKQLIGSNLEDGERFLIEYLIDSLDEHGFLSRDLDSVRDDLLINDNKKVNESELIRALDALKQLEPCGVGAASLQECLLIQLKTTNPLNLIAQKIILNHYKSFSNKNFELLIKEYSINKTKLEKIYKTVEGLNPIPAAGFSKHTSNVSYIYPDFSISTNNSELTLQINKGGIKQIKVSRYYENLLKETSDKKTKVFLTEKIEKAKWFKESIKKRGLTLKKVMTAIIDFQKNYLLSGLEKDIKPMRLADIANIVQLDISTISRVSNSKYVETHFGTFKVKEFFSDAYRKDNGEVISTKEIKTRLKKIISTEDKKKPYTDEELSELLGRDEYHIARRTVAKYREVLGLENAKLRRRL